MNTIMDWFLTQLNRIRSWWSDNYEQIEENVEQWVRRLNMCFDSLARHITILMITGVIFNIVSSYFYPEFPEKIPIIYGWFDGWLQFGEFAFKAILGGIYSFFTGHWSEFWAEYNEAYQELFQQFANWLSNIHF